MTNHAREPTATERHHASFVIVDPSLRNVVGHYFAYDLAVSDGATAAGYDPVVLGAHDIETGIAEQLGARPVFARDVWGLAAQDSGRKLTFINKLRDNARFGWDLLRGLRQVPLPQRSVIFAHTFIDRQFLALALLPFLLFRHRGVRFNYLLRYQPEFYAGRLASFSFRLLERAARWRSIHLTTDSARLADQLERLTTLPVHVLPIPHVPPPSAKESRDSAAPITFVSLGNARDEKGIFEILDAIRILHRTGELRDMRFVLQCNDPAPDVKTAIDRFAADDLPNCELLHDSLDSAEYYRRLIDADVGLVPYWRSIYLARTSGVFMEALSAGKAVIATRDTWMSDQLEEHGAGILCADRDAPALADAMLRAKRERNALAARAAAARDAWLAAHNPRALVAAIDTLPAGSVPPPRPPRRVVIIYPHDDVIGGQSGASRRVNLLAGFLTAHGLSVRIVQGGTAGTESRPGIRIEALGPEPGMPRVRRCVTLAIRILSAGKGDRHFWVFWHYVRMALSRAHRMHLRQAIRWADVVLLQYPFWAGTVLASARAEGRRVVLEEIDVIAEQMDGLPMLRAAAWFLEARALRRASAVVAVSATDAALLRQHRLDPILAANPTDDRLFAIDRIPSPRDILATVYDVDLPSGEFCLFVGSGHAPNVLAVADLRAIAIAMRSRPDGSHITIVVAGSCAEPERDGNFIALGRVDDSVLLALYAACSVILVPIPYGTGSSVKSVEGLATGRPVVGTTASFRGLELESGLHAVIEDDMGRYADIITSICNDPIGSGRMGAAGRTFARAYLPSQTFRPYLELLGLQHETHVDVDTDRSIDRSLHRIARTAFDAGHDKIAKLVAREILRLDPADADAAFIITNRAVTPPLPEPVLPVPEDLPAADAESPAPEPVAEPVAEPVDPLAGWLTARQPLLDAIAAGDHRAAIACGQALLSEHADIAELHFLLARSLHEFDTDPDAAFTHYTRALHLGFDPYVLLAHRGRLCLSQDRNKRAAKDLVRAVPLQPFRIKSWPTYRQAAIAVWRFGRQRGSAH